MTKSYLFAVALLSLVVAGGCAKGGNGIVPSVTVTATSPVDVNALAIYPTQKVTLTAVISNQLHRHAQSLWNAHLARRANRELRGPNRPNFADRRSDLGGRHFGDRPSADNCGSSYRGRDATNRECWTRFDAAVHRCCRARRCAADL